MFKGRGSRMVVLLPRLNFGTNHSPSALQVLYLYSLWIPISCCRGSNCSFFGSSKIKAVIVTFWPLFSFVLSLFSIVRAWVGVGSLCFVFRFLFWPSMVLNQRQVSLVVSDWESYLGSLGFTVGLSVFVSVSVFGPHGTVSVLFTFIVLSSLSVQFIYFYKR